MKKDGDEKASFGAKEFAPEDIPCPQTITADDYYAQLESGGAKFGAEEASDTLPPNISPNRTTEQFRNNQGAPPVVPVESEGEVRPGAFPSSPSPDERDEGNDYTVTDPEAAVTPEPVGSMIEAQVVPDSRNNRWRNTAFVVLLLVTAVSLTAVVTVLVMGRDSSSGSTTSSEGGGSSTSTPGSDEGSLTLSPTTGAPTRPPPPPNATWTQLGQTLVGSKSFDSFGGSIAMSSDGRIVAGGAPRYSYVASGASHVRVYGLTRDNQWDQIGQTLVEETEGDFFGSSIALSSDGLSLTVGASGHNATVYESTGRIYVYQFDVSKWQQIGQALDGTEERDRFGDPVAMSLDGRIIAGAAPGNYVRVYRLTSDNQWEQLGQTLVPNASGSNFGSSVALSSNGLWLTVGANEYDANSRRDPGRAYVYRFTGSDWQQVGQAFEGTGARDLFGSSVAMSSDGSIVAGGAPQNDINGDRAGQVRVYRLVGDSQWEQMGQTLLGESSNDRFGSSVAFSNDGLALIVGASNVEGHGVTRVSEDGRIYVYRFDGSDWQQVGQSLDGTGGGNYGDYFGGSVAISSDGSIIAGGATGNDDNGDHAGHVRVFFLGQS